MSLPANAHLVAVAQAGPRARNGDPGAPVTVWTGQVRAYLTSRERIRALAATRQTALLLEDAERVEVLVVGLRALRAAGAPTPAAGADWKAHTVVIADARTQPAVQRRWTVDGAQVRAAGTPVDDVVLQLSDPRSP